MIPHPPPVKFAAVSVKTRLCPTTDSTVVYNYNIYGFQIRTRKRDPRRPMVKRAEVQM